MRKALTSLLALGIALAASNAMANTFVTLGTQGGPSPQPDRSQPANALVRDDGAIMVIDAGDGAAQQLAKAGLSSVKVDTIFLSHLHFDHTAGVLGMLALRYQMSIPGSVTIYGPPGTKAFINGLLAAMKPFQMSGFGVPGEKFEDPANHIKVVEIVDGTVLNIGNVKVTAAKNTHYSFPLGSELDREFESLSFRFDMPDRSIVYTGDTGPSDNVTRMAKGADILVSEVIDAPRIVAIMKRQRPDVSSETMAHLVEHQQTQHLPYREVGKMAQAAGVRSVVLTHFVPGTITPTDEIRYRKEIASFYAGPIVFAKDLDRF